MWRDDIELWLKECQHVLVDLGRVREALQSHELAINAHFAAVQKHETAEQTHEQLLAGSTPGSARENLAEMAAEHQVEASHHQLQREAHERIKKHHHTMIARCSLLLKATQDSM